MWLCYVNEVTTLWGCTLLEMAYESSPLVLLSKENLRESTSRCSWGKNVDPYMLFDNDKDMWSVLETKSGSQTLVVNCMSWNISMTTRWLMSAPWLSRLLRYSHLPRNRITLLVCYRTILLPETSLSSFLLRGGTLLVLWNTRFRMWKKRW